MNKHLCAGALALVASCSKAQTLDPGFGTGGIAIHDFGQAERVFDATLDADGRIIVAGNTEDSGGDNDFMLARFNTDGTIDTGFGTNGWLVAPEPGMQTNAAGVVVQGDGRILALGWRSTGVTSRSFIRRYMPDGTLDPSFGSGGEWESDLNDHESPAAIALLPDGRIHIAGARINPLPNNSRPFVYRVNANGTTDTSFGTLGAAELSFSGATNFFGDMVVYSDGKVAISGNATFASAFIARFDPDGVLDSSFDADGILYIEDVADVEEAWRMALRADGSIVAAVGRYGNVGEVWLYLVASDGSLVPYGGAIGVNVNVATDWYLSDLELDAAQRVLMTGIVIGAASDEGVLSRAEDAGLDPLFGTNGTVVVPVAETPATRKLLQRPNGDLLVIGQGATADFDSLDVWMAQYTNVPVGMPEPGTPVALQTAPNPASDQLTIQCGAAIARYAGIVVHDLAGRELRVPFRRSSDRIFADVSQLPCGAYTLTLMDGRGSRTTQFVKH